MKLIKMLGLGAAAATAAIAFVGATSASATYTQLCDVHSGLLCVDAATHVNYALVTRVRFLSSLVDVLCDSHHGLASVLGLANPQLVHILSLLVSGCESSGGDGCAVTVLELPLANLLKTGLDQGILTFENGRKLVECEDVFFGTDLHCVYDYTGLSLSVGAQHLTASETQIDQSAGSSLCPDETFLDGLLEIEGSRRYVLS